MAVLFARRLVAGTQEWEKVLTMWRASVRAILEGWVEDGTISQEQYKAITRDV